MRCDDSYCAAPAIDALARVEGVARIEGHVDEDPPRIVVSFDPDGLSANDVVNRMAAELEALGDPRYERELAVEWR